MMDKLTVDGLIAVIFLVALVLLRKFETVLRDEDKYGYRHIAAGISTLSLTAVLSFTSQASIYSFIPALGDAGFVQLLVWIGAITGLVLVISGVSSWLPLAQQQRRYGRERTNRLETITQIMQLIRIENRFLELLSSSLSYLAKGCCFDRAALFAVSPLQKKSYLVRSSKNEPNILFEPAEIQFDERIWGLSHSPRGREKYTVVKSYPANLERASIVQPIYACNRVVAIMLFWSSVPEESLEETRQTVSTAAKLLGRRGRTALLEEQIEYFAAGQDLINSITGLEVGQKDLKSAISIVASALRSQIPLEVLSLTEIPVEGTMNRYTLGTNGALLEEIGLDSMGTRRALERVGRIDKTITLDRNNGASGFGLNALFEQGHKLSQLVSIMTLDNGSTAVMACRFGSVKKYRCRYRFLLESVSSFVLQKLNATYAVSQKEKLQKQIVSAIDYATILPTLENSAAAEMAVGLIAGNTESDAVRISALDSDLPFLNSFAERHKKPFEIGTPSNGFMILSLMPRHEEAIESDGSMFSRYGLGYGDFTDAERNQVFGPGIKSMQIIPIKMGSRTLLISLGSTESALDIDSTLFANLIGRLLAQQLWGRELDVLSGVMADSTGKGTINVRGQLRNALSGVLGAMELMETSGSEEGTSRRYLHIMRRSVEKLGVLTGEQSNTDRVTQPESHETETPLPLEV